MSLSLHSRKLLYENNFHELGSSTLILFIIVIRLHKLDCTSNISLIRGHLPKFKTTAVPRFNQVFIRRETDIYSNQQACGMTQLNLAGVSHSASSSREKQNLA